MWGDNVLGLQPSGVDSRRWGAAKKATTGLGRHSGQLNVMQSAVKGHYRMPALMLHFLVAGSQSGWQAGPACSFASQALLLRKYLIVACSCCRSCVCSVSTHQRCCSSAEASASGQVLIPIPLPIPHPRPRPHPEACHRGAVPC